MVGYSLIGYHETDIVAPVCRCPTAVGWVRFGACPALSQGHQHGLVYARKRAPRPGLDRRECAVSGRGGIMVELVPATRSGHSRWDWVPARLISAGSPYTL